METFRADTKLAGLQQHATQIDLAPRKAKPLGLTKSAAAESSGCLRDVTVTCFQAVCSFHQLPDKKEQKAMLHRRAVLSLVASAGTVSASGIVLAKEKHHLDGNALLGAKIKQNGKHKIHTAGKVDVFAEVSNGKVMGVSAQGMQVKKVKTQQRLAETNPRLILAGMQVAQTDVYYYGYWVYDPIADYYYWFTSDVVIVDARWAPYVPSFEMTVGLIEAQDSIYNRESE